MSPTIRQHEGVDAGRRQRGSECVSSLTLDRYLVDELPIAERGRLATHLAACHTCSDLYASFKADREQFAAGPIASLAADALARPARRPPPWRRWMAWPALALCAGAAALLLVPQNRIKGGFSLSPYVLHPERAATGTLHLGESLHPGDRLQFRYNGATGGYLAVVAIDATGSVSVYYPAGATAASVQAGREVELRSAVELDGTLGREVVVAVRCDRPVAVADVVRAAENGVKDARARGASPTDLGPLGLPCDETRHSIAKTERPGP